MPAQHPAAVSPQSPPKPESDVLAFDNGSLISSWSGDQQGERTQQPSGLGYTIEANGNPELRSYLGNVAQTPTASLSSDEASIRLHTAHVGKLLRSQTPDRAGEVLEGEFDVPPPKPAANINKNAAAERIRAKKRMAQTVAQDEVRGSQPAGLLNLETLKTLFSVSMDASNITRQHPTSHVYKKSKAAAINKQKRALDGVLKDDTDLARIVKESERVRELMAKEAAASSDRPKSEPGTRKKKQKTEASVTANKTKKQRRKKKKQDLSRFQVDLRVYRPPEAQADPNKRRAQAVNINAVVKKANLSLQEYRLIEMRYADIERSTTDLPRVLYSALEQYSDPSDESTAKTISRNEAKAVLEELEMSFDSKVLEAILDSASENSLDANSVNFKSLSVKLMKKYKKDTVCVQLGSAAARRAAQPFSNLGEIIEGDEMDDDCTSASAAPHTSFLSSNSIAQPSVTPNLPPLKIQQAQAIRHLRKDGNFDENYGRETPHVLHSNAQVSIQELRQQLRVSEEGLQQLNAQVKKGVQWVQLNCPTAVKNNRAKKYCKQWGVEKLKRFLLGQDASIQSFALSKWMDFVQLQRNTENVDKFIKVKTCHKIYNMLTTFCQRQVAGAFVQWSNFVADERNKEFAYCSIEIQRLVRGFLGRRFAHDVLRDAAACKIQNRFKCKKAQRITEGLREERRRHSAARLLQNKYRGYTECKKASWIVKGKREQKSASCIQTQWRGRKDRKRVSKMREEKEMNESAALLQRRFRGFEARKGYAEKKHEKERNDAACVIQRKYRGMQGQLIYAHKKLEKESAMKIQSCWRVHLAKKTTSGKMQMFLKKKQMEEEDKAARIMQGKARQYGARKKVGRMRAQKEAEEQDKAARIMQGKARQYGARKKVNRKRQQKRDREEQDSAATKLQNRFRGFEAKKTVQKKRDNKRLMEEERKKRWQAQHDDELRKELEEQDKAARVMQGKARQYGARKKVNKKRLERERHKAAKIIQRAYRTHRFLMKFNKRAHERKLRWMKEAEEKAAREAEFERQRKELEVKEMNAAATKIQVAYRGRRARLKLEKRKNELAVLEAEAERKRVLAEQNAGAQRIANFMRIITAKIKVRRKKAEHKKRLAELEAAGDLGAAEIEAMKKKMQAEIQAMELSASMQAEQDKKDLQKADKEHKEALAIEQALENEQEENEKEHAALKIQNAYRKRRARLVARKQRKEKLALMQKMKEEKAKAEEEKAKKEALELQLRIQMEEESRKREAALLIEQSRAAVKIQGCYRSRLARKKVEAKKKQMLKEAEMIKKKAETMQLRIAREKKSLNRLKGDAKDKKMKEIQELEGKAQALIAQSKEARADAIRHGLAGNMAVDAERKKFEQEQAARIALLEEEQRMNEAASKIQSCYRIRKAKKTLEEKKQIALMKANAADIQYKAPDIGPPLGTFIRPGSIHRLTRYQDGEMDFRGDEMEAMMEAQAAEFVKRENAKAAKELAERRKIEKEKALQDFAIAKREFELVFGDEFDIADKKKVDEEIRKAQEEAAAAARNAAEEADKKIKEMEDRFNQRLTHLENWEKKLVEQERGAESQKLMALHAQSQALSAQRELEDRHRHEASSSSSAIVTSNPEEVAAMNSKRAITPSKRVEWKKLWDEEAKGYYYMNEATNQAQWERPEEGRGVVIIDTEAGGKSGGEVTDYDTDNAEFAGFGGGGGGKGKTQWQELQDEGSGRQYWYNPDTGESVWEDPNGKGGGDVDVEEAKKWVSHIDPSTGTAYWYNAETGETKWEDQT